MTTDGMTNEKIVADASGRLRLHAAITKWPMKAPFRITGYTFTEIDALTVSLHQDGPHQHDIVGRGEALGVYYHRETPASMLAQIELVRGAIEEGLTRAQLQELLFRGAYEQVGNTIALWADQGVNRQLASGWSIPMTWFQSINSLVVFTVTPFLLAHWAQLARRGVQTPWLGKMAFGAAIVGVSYLMLAVLSAWCEAHGTRANWTWLAAWFVLMTVGELYILPVGLGLFGRLAPEGFRATSIAIWFFAGFFGNLLAGALGTLWTPLSHAGFFALIGAVAGLSAGLLVMLGRRAGRVENQIAVDAAIVAAR